MGKFDLISDLAEKVKKGVKGLDQVYLGNQSEILGITKWLPTGIWSMDWMLGGKGLPFGRIVELYGDFSSGKSWFGYVILGKAQTEGCVSVLIETEGSYDPSYAQLCGIDTSKLLVVSPSTVEDVFKVTDIIFKENSSNVPVVIVWDSIAASPTVHEIETGMDTKDMTKAQKMGQGLRIVTKCIEDNGGMFVAINQVRDMIGVMFGPTETTPGGRAMEFHSSVRLKFSKAGKILDANKDVIGQKLKIECTKSKICVPFKTINLELMPGQPVQVWEGMLELLKKKGMIVDNKGWNTFIGDEEKWRDSQFGERIQTELGKKVLEQFLGGMK